MVGDWRRCGGLVEPGTTPQQTAELRCLAAAAAAEHGNHTNARALLAAAARHLTDAGPDLPAAAVASLWRPYSQGRFETHSAEVLLLCGDLEPAMAHARLALILDRPIPAREELTRLLVLARVLLAHGDHVAAERTLAHARDRLTQVESVVLETRLQHLEQQLPAKNSRDAHT